MGRTSLGRPAIHLSVVFSRTLFSCGALGYLRNRSSKCLGSPSISRRASAMDIFLNSIDVITRHLSIGVDVRNKPARSVPLELHDDLSTSWVVPLRATTCKC